MFCKILGHKFVMSWWNKEDNQYQPKLTDFCVKCGILKNEIPFKMKVGKQKAQIIKKTDPIDDILDGIK